MMVEIAEFPEKIFLRELLGLAVYQPRNPELVELKQLFDRFIAGEHPRHEKLKWIYQMVFNLVLKLADNDEHYLYRLKAFWAYFVMWRPQLNKEWLEAWNMREGENK
jgi:hypothetical protein